MEQLSDKQKMVFDFLKDEVKRNGYPPTVREICAAIGLQSTSTAHTHLEALEKKGYIRRSATKNRAIEILGNNFYTFTREMVNVPVVSAAVSGAPLLAMENIEGVFPVLTEDAPSAAGGDAFILRLTASEAGAGFREGDFLLIDRKARLKNGDLAAMLPSGGGALTVSVYHGGDSRKNNRADETGSHGAEEVAGKVVRLYRKY